MTSGVQLTGSLSGLNFDVVAHLLRPFLLGMPRITATVLVLPLLPQQTFPVLVRTALVVALVLGAYRMLAAIPALDWSPLQWVAFTAKESFIGAVIGYATGVLIWVFASLGSLIDNQAGMSNATIFDPFGGHQGGPYSSFMSQLGVLLFIGLGGLYVLIALLYESLSIWPVASFSPAVGDALRDFALLRFESLMSLVVRLAAPVIAALVIVELGIGLINRVAPQLNVFFFSMPIKGALAALMLALLLARLADVARTEVDWLRGLAPLLKQTWGPR